jgi:hypothetical protein
VSHIIIIIDAKTPPPTSAAATSEDPPEFSVSVTYRPAHGLTSSQIGTEVARITRRVDQIIEGGVD